MLQGKNMLYKDHNSWTWQLSARAFIYWSRLTYCTGSNKSSDRCFALITDKSRQYLWTSTGLKNKIHCLLQNAEFKFELWKHLFACSVFLQDMTFHTTKACCGTNSSAFTNPMNHLFCVWSSDLVAFLSTRAAETEPPLIAVVLWGT